MTKLAEVITVSAIIAGLVGCGGDDKGADLAACKIEADKAFPTHEVIYYSDRVMKCMRVRGWHFTYLGDIDGRHALPPHLCEDLLGPSALEEGCYERNPSSKKAIGEFN